MKRIAILTLILILSATHAAFAAPPRVSPTASASQVVGVSEIDVAYARPSVNERAIWGELVPYGQIWRTGANEATKITFSHDAKVEGKPIAAGTYALFTLPEKGKWTVILNKEAEQWGAFNHDAEKDALRVEVRPEAAPHQEQFAIGFADVDTRSAKVVMHWEKLAAASRWNSRRQNRLRGRLEGSRREPAGVVRLGQLLLPGEPLHRQSPRVDQRRGRGAPDLLDLRPESPVARAHREKGEAMELAKKAIQMAEEGENQFAKQAAGQLEEEIAAW